MSVFSFCNSILLRSWCARTLVKYAILIEVVAQTLGEIFSSIICAKYVNVALKHIFLSFCEILETHIQHHICLKARPKIHEYGHLWRWWTISFALDQQLALVPIYHYEPSGRVWKDCNYDQNIIFFFGLFCKNTWLTLKKKERSLLRNKSGYKCFRYGKLGCPKCLCHKITSELEVEREVYEFDHGEEPVK